MHEFAITSSMFALVKEQAERANAGKVTRINLVIGEMSGIVRECVEFYFNYLRKGTLAEDATLSFRMVPANYRCRNCGNTFEFKGFSYTCPSCGGRGVEIIAGEELLLESIEVE